MKVEIQESGAIKVYNNVYKQQLLYVEALNKTGLNCVAINNTTNKTTVNSVHVLGSNYYLVYLPWFAKSNKK